MIAVAFKAIQVWLRARLGKSVTTPIAMEVSSHLGGEAAIAAILVLIVGLFGAIFAYPIYNLIGIKSPIASGFNHGHGFTQAGYGDLCQKRTKKMRFQFTGLSNFFVALSLLNHRT